MSLYDLNEFFKLSSVLNYNLSAAALNRQNVLMFITADKPLDEDPRRHQEYNQILLDALEYLFAAYRKKRRRLGPMAVLHPLRATILFARSAERLNYLNLISVMFHDVLEDIRPQDFADINWREMETRLYALLERMPSGDEKELMFRLEALTKLDGESYYGYIGRLLRGARRLPDVVLVKLADRLDNTLDMRVDIQDPMEGVNFFENLFQILFVRNFPGYRTSLSHPMSSPLNGAKRLYQLFKNAVLLSLIRQYPVDGDNARMKTLFDAVAEASLSEAQRTLLHLMGYHFQDVSGQRQLLLDAMDYCYSGRSSVATKPGSGRDLDGLFSGYFGLLQSKERNLKLAQLYKDKPLMMQACVAFITIFLSFLNDASFFVEGISTHGISPK
jgi:hypothetical protein